MQIEKELKLQSVKIKFYFAELSFREMAQFLRTTKVKRHEKISSSRKIGKIRFSTKKQEKVKHGSSAREKG